MASLDRYCQTDRLRPSLIPRALVCAYMVIHSCTYEHMYLNTQTDTQKCLRSLYCKITDFKKHILGQYSQHLG